jgi:hypothetical protein
MCLKNNLTTKVLYGVVAYNKKMWRGLGHFKFMSYLYQIWLNYILDDRQFNYMKNMKKNLIYQGFRKY